MAAPGSMVAAPNFLQHLQGNPQQAGLLQGLLGLHSANNLEVSQHRKTASLIAAQANAVALNEIREEMRPMNAWVLGPTDPTTIYALNQKPTFSFQLPKAWIFNAHFGYREDVDDVNWAIISLAVGSLNIIEPGSPPCPLSLLSKRLPHQDRIAAAILAESTDILTVQCQMWCLVDNKTFGGIWFAGTDGNQICALTSRTQAAAGVTAGFRKAGYGLMDLVHKTFQLGPITFGAQPSVIR